MASPAGADYVYEQFATRRRSWYVVSRHEETSIADISRVHRRMVASFVIYSVRGEPFRFQYKHEWEDADSGGGFDYPRSMALFFQKKGIFDTMLCCYSSETMAEAKLALLGLDPNSQDDVQRASNVSDLVLLAFLCHIGVYAGNWEFVLYLILFHPKPEPSDLTFFVQLAAGPSVELRT